MSHILHNKFCEIKINVPVIKKKTERKEERDSGTETYADSIRHSWVILTYLNYLLTPRCRVLLEKLTGLQLDKKFPAFHGTRRFITALTSVHHLSLSWASPVQLPYKIFYCFVHWVTLISKTVRIITANLSFTLFCLLSSIATGVYAIFPLIPP